MRVIQALRTYWLYTVSLSILIGCQNSGRPSRPAEKLADARIANARAADNPGSISTPTGRFDYYVFTLSWAPEYCHGHRNSPECNGSHPGFVVHGLWPQYSNGQWPSQCSNAPGLSNPAIMLDIMPDLRLIEHEWTTHGTCTGLTANQYFRTVRQAYQSIHIPPALVNPSQPGRQSATEIKHLFTNVNPGVSADQIAVSCHNRYLAGIEFCLSKTLEPTACQAVRDCNARSITIPTAP